mmetsp:Transcript_12705/g.11267  ORF Transcript_12705/g.11267 Transcript_12705/m.11267 type:complete len:89 (+) Transcript_12705:347-613(+)
MNMLIIKFLLLWQEIKLILMQRGMYIMRKPNKKAEEYGLELFEVSALENINVKEMFECIVAKSIGKKSVKGFKIPSGKEKNKKEKKKC